MRSIKTRVLIGSLAFCLVGGLAASSECRAQTGEQAADQSVVQDDAELMRLNNAQLRQVQGQERQAEEQAALDAQRDETYRLYAEKKVQELEKLKTKSPSTEQQIQVFQNWLRADAAVRLRDIQTIRALQQRIAKLEQTQDQVMSNIGSDVNAVREAGENARADDKFRQMMQINYFNELQTEMGPASWYPPRGGGAFYSMGGLGFNGGQNLLGGY
ncbi:MAG TPA: hypothetical protein V6D17_09435 [Candidatus Obscuribacterales bacterium]